MNWKMWFLTCCCLSVAIPLVAKSQISATKPVSQSDDGVQSVVVPAPVAALLRPILDEKQKGAQHDESRLSNLLYRLTQQKGRVADEALVVLMCFDVGESQEETDAVIGRGRRMLMYLKKYQDRSPKISGRTYPSSMFRDSSGKADAFEGAVKAIKRGWHSTADNPAG